VSTLKDEVMEPSRKRTTLERLQRELGRNGRDLNSKQKEPKPQRRKLELEASELELRLSERALSKQERELFGEKRARRNALQDEPERGKAKKKFLLASLFESTRLTLS
jgi:hypothetical protein